ncbi:TetR/AcrR family transcriptional regulator [Seonamhaeicola algicola]|uniref:TetR/AcrR family transcriptional regulator n=1 Tax=Seonamhaeicola algicola TaxID=1719036 RepID=A0A5C7B2V6_9FLAO|nr:TetR family transcriptional regulator C-terminal domain-containing protein [Seonamhaeicola algicola]TXE15061.1 TetR/AcrR family transcriptional regulator [Seonamhaeicola algicola]
MAKKKNITKTDLISMYMDFVLEHNEDPKSVYKFSKDNNFDEALFYQSFTSFEAIKNEIFTVFFENTIDLLHKSEEFESFDARNQLLSFYYTFFEMLTANRSYVVYALKQQKNKLDAVKSLKGLKHGFTKFIDGLNIEKLDIKQERLEKIQNKALCETAWLQLVVTIKFWLDDSSAGFEKTDLFIEKSVNASFDVINIAPVKSVIDLGKFLFKEKMMQ